MIRPERSWLTVGAISVDLLDKAAGLETFGAAYLAFVTEDELLRGRAVYRSDDVPVAQVCSAREREDSTASVTSAHSFAVCCCSHLRFTVVNRQTSALVCA